MRKLVLLLFICICSGTSIFAVDILNISTITDRNGLSQNTIHCMLQDKRGFMWMGTINGLNRYNGRDFAVIHPQLAMSRTLRDSRIRAMVEDKQGFIWVRTFSNTLFCYDPKQERMIDFDPSNPKKAFSKVQVLSNGDVWMWGKEGCCRVRYVNGKQVAWRPVSGERVRLLFEDSDAHIWIGSGKKLFCIKEEKLITVSQDEVYLDVQEIGQQLYFIGDCGIHIFEKNRVAFQESISIPKIKSISYIHSCQLNDGILLIATNKKLYIFDTKKRQWLRTDTFFPGRSMVKADFTVDNKGNIWVYNMSGNLWRHRPDNTFEKLKLIPPDVLSLISQERFMVYHDSRDIIWITTFGNGLFSIDERTGEVRHYTADKDLPTNYLFCVTEDRSGEIWVGTELNGVVKISLSNYPFGLFNPASEGRTDRNNAVRLIYEDRNACYWFGTRDGNLYMYDSSFKQQHAYRILEGLPFSMAEDTLGYKWLGTKGGGLLLFSPNGEKIVDRYILRDHVRRSAASNNIFTVMRDNKGRMWLATFGGGVQLAERKEGKILFRQFAFGNEHLNMMRSMVQDRSGLIWVGTNDGVVVFEPDELIRDADKFQVLHLCTKEHLSLGHNEVKVIFEDSKGRIWIGTTGGGLNILQRQVPLEQSWFKHLGASEGLLNETVQAIQEDGEGNIWVSTESGISKYNLKTGRFENFVSSNSQRTTVFNEMSCWKKANGDLMFGSYNGVYIFNPSDIQFDTYAPRVLITGLWINGHSVKPGEEDSPLQESIVNTKKVVLEHNQCSFNLECTMMNYHGVEQNQYACYLEGYEDDWNYNSRNNVAVYRNIPPGTYTFKVKGCNSFGVWSKESTELEIVILPPWWKSGRAIAVYIVLGLIIGFVTFKLILKMHRLNMAVAVEKQLTEYKLRFFTNISHEFRTPLTIIRGAIEDLSNRNDAAVDRQLALLTKSSNRLMRLIDQLLEFRRLQNNKMELKLEHTSAERFFYEIYLTFKDMARKKNIDYRFESNGSEQDVLLDRGKMDKIAYNLLSNAFKNTPDNGTIVMRLDFSVAKDSLTMSVSDSGPGVPSDKRKMLFVRFEQIHYTASGTGIGLHLTSELARVHKGSISYSDSVYGGACFSLTVPLSDKNYDSADIIETALEEEAKQMPELVTDELPATEKMENVLGVSASKPFNEYKVMIIDDDEDVRNLIEMQLGRYFTILTASNGAEGLNKLNEEQPDLVICDIMMPEMDGIEFTKRLKKNFNISHIPVILLTAYSSEEHQLEGIRAGADSYITKPFSVKYLMTRVVKLIEQREKLQCKFASEPGTLQPLISTTDRDKAFLNKIQQIIEQNMGNTEFKLESYASSLGLGRTTFFSKLKSIAGCSPNEYVRILRLKKAAELLITSELNISEIGYKVGIDDPYYFSKCFKNLFGKSPSQYRKEPGTGNKPEIRQE